MAEPLIISFAADTSRAQSAMATLTAQIVGNVTQMGIAMQGGASNANAFGGSLGAVAANLQKAAAAVGQDIKNISTATANAATADKATLESVVRAFTGAAVASNTASGSLKAGLQSTTGVIQGVASQLPSLQTLLGAFLAFEAVKLVFASVSASIDAAREHIADFVKIGQDAQRAGVSTGFFQRATLDADKFGLKVEQIALALEHARAASEIHIGEGKDGTNTSSFSNRLEQNVRAGNISRGDRTAFDQAGSQEDRIKIVLNLIDQLRDKQKDAAAFDLAGKFFGPDFERQLRSGIDLTNQLRDTLNSTSTTVAGIRIIGDDEVQRANELDAKAKDIANTLATALAPIQRDISNATLDTYQAFLDIEQVIARVVTSAVNLYTQISGVVGQVRDLVGSVPYIGKLITASNPITFLNEYLKTGKSLLQGAGVLDPDVQGPPEPPKRRVRVTLTGDQDQSNKLPSLGGRKGREGSESLDAVETYINQLEKARDVARAELENVGKTNVERTKSVDLAKAEAAAREANQRGQRSSPTLTDAERTKVLSLAEDTAKAEDSQKNLEQQLRQNAEAARLFSDSLSNGLADAIVNGKSFGSELSDIVKQLERSAITGLLTGTGPLAGLLGTAPLASAGPNATGGLLGGLFGGVGGTSAGSPLPGAQGPSLSSGGLGAIGDLLGGFFRANGGPVTAGRPYTVGEMGRELFVPQQDGQIVPVGKGSSGSAGGVGSYTHAPTYNITPAGGVTPQQMVAALARYDEESNRKLAQRLDMNRKAFN